MFSPTKREEPSEQIHRLVKSGQNTTTNRYISDIDFDKQFGGDIHFVDCEVGKITLNSSNITSVDFKNCPFIETINVTGNTTNLRISVDGDLCQVGSINVTDSRLGALLISNANVKQINILSEPVVDQTEGFSINLKNVKVETHFVVHNYNLEKFTVLSSSFDRVQLEIGRGSELSVKSTVLNYLSIQGNKIGAIEMSNCNSKRISLNLSRLIKLEAHNLAFNEQFELTTNRLGKLKIHNSADDATNEIVLLSKGDNPTVSEFYLTGLKLSVIDLERVPQIDNLILHNTVVTNELNLVGVKLLNTEFNILNIKTARLKIHRTEFNNLTLANVEWSTQNRAYELAQLRMEKQRYIFELRNLRESYRKLKVHFLIEHNYFDAMLFGANELRVEQRIRTKELLPLTPISFWNHFGDWFVLSTNKWFSNFGLSWTRPLILWLCIFHAIPLFFILRQLGIHPVFTLNEIDWATTQRGFEIYLKLLFPIHDSTIKPFDLSPHGIDIWGFPDFTIRVIASYFIFLIIRGTRKYNFRIG